MGFYKEREQFQRQFAESHAGVKHNQPVSDTDASLRQSFFRINDEAELMAACSNWIHFPCIVHYSLSGTDVNRDGAIRQRNDNQILFLDKAVSDPANPIEATAITEAYDKAFEVMLDYKQAIYDEYEESEGCGVFYRLIDGSFKWLDQGPIGDRLYGWLLSFSDETKPRI